MEENRAVLKVVDVILLWSEQGFNPDFGLERQNWYVGKHLPMWETELY